MVPPETFRRGRIESFIERLSSRRTMLQLQLKQPEFQEIHQLIQGQLKEIDLVINELMHEFGLEDDE